ncbi:MAG: glycoside hydrolase family 16 protein [Erythrobacter sp.]
MTFATAAAGVALATAGCDNSAANTSGNSSAGAEAAAAAELRTDRELLFADEFNNAELDRSKWNVVGMDFWVNEELQAYLDTPDTLSIAQNIDGADGGALVLHPVYRPGVDSREDRNADFISGRINTRDKFDFTHGRVEARIKMPDAIGVWPAFWLLGNGQWPETGEIDIMEYVGESDWTGVALHGPGYSGETPIVNKFVFPDGQDATQWHTYSVEWTSDAVLFEVDDRLTYRATREMVEYYGEWRFDTPKFAILNFAVGGIYPAKTNGIKQPYYGLPAETAERIKNGEIAMEVDWVRVYAPK